MPRRSSATLGKEKNLGAEDSFFSNTLTIITVGVAVLLFLINLMWGIESALNGSASPQSVWITTNLQNYVPRMVLYILGPLLLAGLVRWIASWDKTSKISSRRLLQIISLLLLFAAVLIEIFYIGIYAGWWL